MKIQIRPRGMTLTKPQHVRLTRKLDLVLARFAERIDRVIVSVSDAEVAGLTSCEIEARFKPQIVRVEHSDTDVFLAVEHALMRAARSVSRAFEAEGLIKNQPRVGTPSRGASARQRRSAP
jgi:ribosome-associated translation inhibitor RaiA